MVKEKQTKGVAKMKKVEQKVETQGWLIDNMIHDLQSLKVSLINNKQLLDSGCRRKTSIAHLKDSKKLIQKTLNLLEVA